MQTQGVNRANLCRNTIIVGYFGGVLAIILGILTYSIALIGSVLFFAMGILLIAQVQTTHVDLKDNKLVLKTFGFNLKQVNIDDIKDIENFKYHNCFIDMDRSRIFSFNVTTKNDEQICFTTGCIRGCALIEILKSVYQQALQKEFNLLECENHLSHLPN